MGRRTGWVWLWAAIAAGVGLAGCALPVGGLRLGRRAILLGPIGSVAADSQPIAAVSGYDDSAWQQLLLKHVAAGWNTTADSKTQEFASPPYPELVEYREILQHPADLNTYLAVLGRTGPASTPKDFGTDGQRLSYYLNAYNACAVRAALADYPSEAVYGPTKLEFEQEWYFRVDGQRVNLDDAAAAGIGGGLRRGAVPVRVECSGDRVAVRWPRTRTGRRTCTRSWVRRRRCACRCRSLW